jgi:hypothetical protein
MNARVEKSEGCVMGGLRSGQGGTWQGWCGLWDVASDARSASW